MDRHSDIGTGFESIRKLGCERKMEVVKIGMVGLAGVVLATMLKKEKSERERNFI